jgi:hypothetical protein
MDFGQAFSFVFRDPDWPKKILLNGLIGLIPIVGQLYLLGWGLETARRVIQQDPYPLPEINFGGWLGHGLRAFVVSLVYSLPIWLFIAPMILVAIAGGLFNLDEDTMGALMGITGICGMLPMIGYGIFMSLILMPALTLTALENSIQAGLRFRETFRLLRAGLGGYLLAWVGTMVAAMGMAFITSFTLGLGAFAAMAYYNAVMGHFYGQAYRVTQPAPAWPAV